MKQILLYCVVMMLSSPLFMGCKSTSQTEQKAAPEIVVPTFDADSAYAYVARQVAFGYRVPGMKSHAETAQWLVDELQRHGAEVVTQRTSVTAYDGTELPICNIIGSFAPEKIQRLLLLAHWDSRPYADYDANPAYRRTPIDGANDGASGVGVLLEIARHIGKQQPHLGIDILLVDAEDYGAPAWVQENTGESWALGSQYWATHPHKPGYRARFGILLDMVGGRDAGFYREQLSQYFAPAVIDKVWQCAERLGYGHLFINEAGGTITDDHLYTNQAGIPTIDIIQYDPNSPTGFVRQWHTREDNMDNIDASVLKAVGQTVLTVIYEEK